MSQKPTGTTATVQIQNWRALHRSTLRGFFSATLPSGIVLHDLSLHEKDGKRWINTPAREWTDQRGDTQYTPYVTFTDRAASDRFRDQLLTALDRYLAEAHHDGQRQEQRQAQRP